MARGELMKKLITSYGRDDKFRTVVEQIIGEEERKGNRVLAGSLRKSLDRLGEGSTQTAPASKLLPFPDEARDFIQRVEPQRTPAELHLSHENKELFAGIIREFRQADRLHRPWSRGTLQASLLRPARHWQDHVRGGVCR